MCGEMGVTITFCEDRQLVLIFSLFILFLGAPLIARIKRFSKGTVTKKYEGAYEIETRVKITSLLISVS